jgi:hypothetical protein
MLLRLLLLLPLLLLPPPSFATCLGAVGTPRHK